MIRGLLLFLLSTPVFAQSLSNPTLVANQDIAKAQAAGVISVFMNEGAKVCDDHGTNCRSVYGAKDTMDYVTMQQQAQSFTGVNAFGFTDPETGEMSNVAVQMGTLALACGETKPQVVVGVAVKQLDCAVTAEGAVRLTYQVCSAPSRSLPVTPPTNEVDCSTNPADPSFFPPAGMSCRKPSCDSAPQGSLNGWSAPTTVTWTPGDTSSNAGLGLTFYPPLGGGVTADFKANSDNMTAVKVVQSYVNTETGKTAVGLRVAYRLKTTVTKAMVEQGPTAIANPEEHSDQWKNMVAMQQNPMVSQFGAKFQEKGQECLQQIQGGLSGDGTVYVCDQEFSTTLADGTVIKPAQKSVRISDATDCGSTQQCLNKVVNTNTWKETCRADVPLAMRNCETVTPHTTVEEKCRYTRETEICTESRSKTTETCEVKATPISAIPHKVLEPNTWANFQEYGHVSGGYVGTGFWVTIEVSNLQPDGSATARIQRYANVGSGTYQCLLATNKYQFTDRTTNCWMEVSLPVLLDNSNPAAYATVWDGTPVVGSYIWANRSPGPRYYVYLRNLGDGKIRYGWDDPEGERSHCGGGRTGLWPWQGGGCNGTELQLPMHFEYELNYSVQDDCAPFEAAVP